MIYVMQGIVWHNGRFFWPLKLKQHHTFCFRVDDFLDFEKRTFVIFIDLIFYLVIKLSTSFFKSNLKNHPVTLCEALKRRFFYPKTL
jgi:hypothetical protein